MQAAELKMKTEKELLTELLKLKREVMNLRFQKASGDNVNPVRRRTVKKDIARVMTVLSDKKKQNKEIKNA
jgi:large subunit ribosomal protein L29